MSSKAHQLYRSPQRISADKVSTSKSPKSGVAMTPQNKRRPHRPETESADAPDSPELADEAASWPAVYVHLPFCARVCPYCDFAVVAGRDRLIERYVAAVLAEIAAEPQWRSLRSVYFGGGTPSRVAPALLAAIVAALGDRFGFQPEAEISLEANPEDWTPVLAGRLIASGFNRVSFGAQSFHPGVLKSLGRAHRPEAIPAALAVARRAGFESVNLDLIYGTPGEGLSEWEGTLMKAMATEPDHVSCYSLTVERGTELYRQVAAGSPGPDPDLQADEYELAEAILARHGLVAYEVSNWARPGHHCRYNLAVWGQAEYLSFGMGAHRFRDGVRSHNLSRLDLYLEAIERGEPPRRGVEPVEGWVAEQERLFLGLRRRAGVKSGEAGRRLLESVEGKELVAAGVLGISGDRLVVLRPLLTDAVIRVVLALSPG
jgi:oxygen-independent coproporphyrinogen-3 oxidase